MLSGLKQFARARWEPHSRRPFVTLVRVFTGRVFHGGESSDSSMDVVLGVVLALLAMPGTIVALMLFEKYGSLVRWMRGDGSFDPFTASIPDEYFFIVLSMVVTGAAAVWRWEALFLDRRDYTNIVPLPIALRKIFFANSAAIFFLAAVLTLDVNAGSFVLFPVVVTGSQNSLATFLRFGFGHAVTVVLASAFSFFGVFALIGVLMALLPYSVFRRVSLYFRFLIALFFLALLGTGFAVPSFLEQVTQYDKGPVLLLPPVWFIGICETLWGNGSNPVYAEMAHNAVLALAIAVVVAVLSYALTFRRSFARLPETAAVGPIPRAQLHLFPTNLFDRLFLRDAPQRACFHFITRTLLRSEAHLQVASAFLAMGLVICAHSVASAYQASAHAAAKAAVAGIATLHLPTEDLLAIPFVLSFGIIIGIRLAFEIPSDLRANWVFALWIDQGSLPIRAIARKVLLTFALVPLIPLCLISSWALWGPADAILHTAIFSACTIAFVEVLLLRFRKIPFTCTYPPFQSQSALTFVAYFFGFILFTMYLPELELWSLDDAWRTLIFPPLIAILLISIQAYRKQMLDMDKHLIFEEPSPSAF
jgi:hypothetical protein